MEVRKRFLPEGWYPADAGECRRAIEAFQDYIDDFTLPLDDIRGGIVPHAGWYFSGRLAALVFHLAAKASQPDIVAVFGGHLGAGPGIAYLDDAWDTPLGSMEMDKKLTAALTEELDLRPADRQTSDNTVEVQLPLMKYYFPNSKLTAFRAPHSSDAAAMGARLVELAKDSGKTIKVFGSTDLTHYGSNYGFSPKGSGDSAVKWVKEVNDLGFIGLATAMDEAGALDHAAKNSSACSAGGAVAAMAACRVLGAERGMATDYYTSHDIMPGGSFVGYSGIVF